MKGLFKSKPRTPPDIVRQTRDLLVYADRSVSTPDLRESKSQEKLAELSKSLRESKLILYGNSEAEPVAEACAQLTLEFFKGETLRGLITSLPYLSLEGRKDATQVNSRLVASDYLESNIDLMDVLVDGSGVTLYGTMFRECIRHQIVAKQKSTVAEFLTKNEEWVASLTIYQIIMFCFKAYATASSRTMHLILSCSWSQFFADFNSKLLESSNYITRRQAIKLLGDILLDRSNSVVMTKYVSSMDNLRILMNLLRESSKTIQIEVFHVFKLFVANQKKPSDIINVLVANRNKLLRLLADLKLDKEDESFEADKAHVVSEIASLKPRDLA
ncbi:hypothetical protein YC2023_002160 [Brassica napus]